MQKYNTKPSPPNSPRLPVSKSPKLLVKEYNKLDKDLDNATQEIDSLKILKKKELDKNRHCFKIYNGDMLKHRALLRLQAHPLSCDSDQNRVWRSEENISSPLSNQSEVLIRSNSIGNVIRHKKTNVFVEKDNLHGTLLAKANLELNPEKRFLLSHGRRVKKQSDSIDVLETASMSSSCDSLPEETRSNPSLPEYSISSSMKICRSKGTFENKTGKEGLKSWTGLPSKKIKKMI